jgi:L-rhamnose mutarotase
MQRVRFVLQVKPEWLEEYKKCHRSVWPEMQAALRETGWGKYTLFLRDGFLVGYLERKTLKATVPGWPSKTNERWQREVGDFFNQPDDVLPDCAMQSLEEVFHL